MSEIIKKTTFIEDLVSLVILGAAAIAAMGSIVLAPRMLVIITGCKGWYALYVVLLLAVAIIIKLLYNDYEDEDVQ